MRDPIYKAQAKPYQEDLNDLVKADIEKGGKGSGVKGHRTVSEAGGGHVWRDKKSGLFYNHKDYMEHNRQGLMNYSGYDDKPGHYMSRHQVAHAIEQHTGHSKPTAHDIADHLEQEGHIKRMGHLHVTMMPGAGKKPAKTVEEKRKEIHEHHKEHSDKETQTSMKRYLDPAATDEWSHKNRVEGEHRVMHQRPSIKKNYGSGGDSAG